jgi:hypothetical protein
MQHMYHSIVFNPDFVSLAAEAKPITSEASLVDFPARCGLTRPDRPSLYDVSLNFYVATHVSKC